MGGIGRSFEVVAKLCLFWEQGKKIYDRLKRKKKEQNYCNVTILIELLRAQVSQGSTWTNTILMPNIEMHDTFWDHLLQV